MVKECEVDVRNLSTDSLVWRRKARLGRLRDMSPKKAKTQSEEVCGQKGQREETGEENRGAQQGCGCEEIAGARKSFDSEEACCEREAEARGASGEIVGELEVVAESCEAADRATSESGV